MEELLTRLDAEMQMLGRARLTREAYLGSVRRFGEHFRRCPSELGLDEVREYLRHLGGERGLAASSRNQVSAALQMLYVQLLGREHWVTKIPRAKTPRILPTVLSGAEVARLFGHLPASPHRPIGMLCYGAGLRVSEACGLQVQHIDSSRGILHIRNAKGQKDRQVTLGPRLLSELRSYWPRRRRCQGAYLFPGKTAGRALSKAAFQRALKAAVAAAGLDEGVTPHTLRHSYATHMIQSGASLRAVQLQLGHASIRSTVRYVHMTHAAMSKVPSPLDALEFPDCKRRR